MGWVHQANAAVSESAVGRYFHLEGSGHRRERQDAFFFTEIRAGLATFFAMAYIIAVNASIVSQTGGTCVCPLESPDLCDTNADYLQCVQEVRRDLVTATAAISALTTFCMGLFANMPIALAPGMGLNAYFTYNVVGYHGNGSVSYQTALTAVFVEGFVFVGLTVFGLRQWLARALPASIKLATGVGIGLCLTIIGLTYSAGIGAITGAQSTPLELAGCPQQYLTEEGICPSSQKMRDPTMWIGIFCGGMFTVFLMLYRVKGAIIAGILLVSIISWPRGTPVTYFPYTDLGNDSFDFFKQVVAFHPIQRILTVQDWSIGSSGGQFGLTFITFLYVDILDTTGTLYSMARFCGAIDETTQDFEGSAIAYLVDAFGVTIGSLFGTPPVTAYIESGAGDAVPAFLTIAIMPFTYSIAYGLIAGVISYIVLNTAVWMIEKASGGRIKPADKHLKEPWTYKIPGGVLPPWLKRAAKGKKDFWRPEEDGGENGAAWKRQPLEGEKAVEDTEEPEVTRASAAHPKN